MSNPMFLVVREEYDALAGWSGKFPDENSVYIDKLYSSYEAAEKTIREQLPYDKELYEFDDELPEVTEHFYGDWVHDSLLSTDKYPVRYAVYSHSHPQVIYDVLFSIVPVFVES